MFIRFRCRCRWKSESAKTGGIWSEFEGCRPPEGTRRFFDAFPAVTCWLPQCRRCATAYLEIPGRLFCFTNPPAPGCICGSYHNGENPPLHPGRWATLSVATTAG